MLLRDLKLAQMKKIYLFKVFVFLNIMTQAQNTVNISGNTLKADRVTYAYSIGEVTGFPLTKNCVYTPGVIQPTRVSVKPPQQRLFDNYHTALLYPNPTTGVVIIETNEPGITEYTVINYDGKLVQTGKFDYISINIKALPKGLYLITLFSTDHSKHQSYKIIKL